MLTHALQSTPFVLARSFRHIGAATRGWPLFLLLALEAGCARPADAPTGWVDRIEGDIAVVVIEDGEGDFTSCDIPLAVLPPSVREGDRLVDGRIDDAGRRRLRARVRALQGLLFGGTGGAGEGGSGGGDTRAPP